MATGHGLLVIERILRDRPGIWRQITEERDLRQLTGQMFVSSAIALALFGAVLGASNGPAQALASAIKLPILFLVTLVVCLPTLYLFNLVFGARLSIRQAVALVAVTVTVLSTLSLAFAPISLFFLVTAPHYEFYKLLNVAIMMLTAIVGLRFIVEGMQALNNATTPTPALSTTARPAPIAQPGTVGQGGPAGQTVTGTGQPPIGPATQPVRMAAEHTPVTVGAELATPAATTVTVPPSNGVAPTPAPHDLAPYPVHPGAAPYYPMPRAGGAPSEHPGKPRSGSMGLLYIWIIVFGFVGTQLGWTLRPFFGSPDEPFQIFRAIEGNFYVDIVHTIGNLF